MPDEEVTDLTEEEGSDGGEKKKKKRFGRKKKDSGAAEGSDEAALPEDEEGEEGGEGEKGKKSKRGRRGKKGKKGKGDDEAGADDESADEEKDELEVKPIKEKRSGGGGGGDAGIVIMMLLAALLLVGGFVAALYYNVFSARAVISDVVRNPLVSFLIWLDPEFSMIDDELRVMAQVRENRLNRREDILEAREQEVLQKEQALVTMEEQLDRRSELLDEREAGIQEYEDSVIPLYARDMTQQELDDMISYATTYTRMSADDAARILVELHTQLDVASILYYMSERNRAPILAAFESEYAAQITEIWLYEWQEYVE